MESRKRKLKAIAVHKAKKVARRTKVADDIKEEETVISDEAPATGSEHVQQSNTEVVSDGDLEPVVVDDDDVMDDEEIQEDTSVDRPEVKSSKVKGLFKPPTHSELQSLKETQDLFSSNLMRLQITELLSEVKPKSSSKKAVESFLHKLKGKLISLPSSEQIDLCDGLSLLSKKVSYPLSLDISNAKGKFQFIAPSVVKVVGGFLLGTLSKPHPSVDLCLHIPVECLQVKDILNYRYFQKRALYLAVVARHLLKKRRSLAIKSIHFSSDNPLLPTLLLALEGSKVAVVLHTSISDDEYFKRSKLTPDHNNVRRYYLSQLPNQSDDIQNQLNKLQSDDPPTPHYNASLLLELGGRERHLVTLYSALHNSPGLIDAVLLCKVWGRQRGLDKGVGGLSGFHFSMLVAWLCSQRRLNAHMSCYQTFRVVMQTFVASDWTTKGIAMSQIPLDIFHDAFEVVFVDGSGLNIFAELSIERYRWMQHEASLALRNLDNLSTNEFQALFMTPLPPEMKFDVLCRLPCHLLSPVAVLKDQEDREAMSLDAAVLPLPLLMKRIFPFLRRGLNRRVQLLTTLPLPSKQWSLSDSPPPPSDDITIALLLDTEHAFSTLEVGPPSDSDEATEFREFWGAKAGLRRFKDGSIREAVVWVDGGGVACGRTIPALIIRHLLERHAGLPGDSVGCIVNSLDPLISLPTYSKHGRLSTGEEVGGGVVGVVTGLGRDLRGLRDIPLSITSVQGCGPAFRHTQVFPYPPWNGRLGSKYTTPPDETSQLDCYYPSYDVATPPFVPVYKVVCQLESSGKWPDDVEAIAKIKTSFYTYISKALKEEKDVISSPTADYLDVLKEGYVFRVMIHYHRELLLLKDAVSKATGSEVVKLKQRLTGIEQELVSLPLLTSWLNGAHQEYPAFAPGARLCKRWISAQLLTNHISDEAVDLMVAYLFLSPAPYTPPAMPLIVLLRFLSLLSSFDWSTEPLIVNFNNELSGSAVSEILTKFTSTRSSLPPMVIATPNNHTHWSTPSPPVFTRLQLLATESLNILLKHTIRDFKQVFRPPLDDYHVIIHLHKRHVPRREQAVDAMATDFDSSQPTVRYKHKCTHLPVMDFDPVEKFVQSLEMSYSDYALFFYDKYGGSYIAVAWKPPAFSPRPFKVMQIECHVKDNKGMVPDTVAMVSDFELLGEGLVKKVEVVSYTP